MLTKLLNIIKRLLILSGLKPSSHLEFLLAVFELGQWFKNQPNRLHFNTKEEFYKYIFELTGGEPFDFLEFGVFQGQSINYWCNLCDNKISRFYGFDSFTGLPRDWFSGTRKFRKGHFDVGGQPPKIDDSRLMFIKGMFQDTLPDFLRSYQQRDRLIVHLDSDLHSSTLFVLTKMDEFLKSGTILMFDDFSVAHHDFKAFIHYANAYNREYRVLATAELNLAKIAIEMK